MSPVIETIAATALVGGPFFALAALFGAVELHRLTRGGE